jgi:hypothetical protein
MFLTALSHNQTKHKSLLTLIVKVLEKKKPNKIYAKTRVCRFGHKVFFEQ